MWGITKLSEKRAHVEKDWSYKWVYDVSTSNLAPRLFLVEVERGNEPEYNATLVVVLLNLTSPQEQKKRGVITASAGNHAVALAYHGRQLNIPVTVVLPENASDIKARVVGSRLYIIHD